MGECGGKCCGSVMEPGGVLLGTGCRARPGSGPIGCGCDHCDGQGPRQVLGYPGGFMNATPDDGWLKPPLLPVDDDRAALSEGRWIPVSCQDNCSVLTSEGTLLERTTIGFLARADDATQEASGLCGSVWATDEAPSVPALGVTVPFAVTAPHPATEVYTSWLLALILANIDIMRMVLCCKAVHLQGEYGASEEYVDALRRIAFLQAAADGRPIEWLEFLPTVEVQDARTFEATVRGYTGDFNARLQAFYQPDDNRVVVSRDSSTFSAFVTSMSMVALGEVPSLTAPVTEAYLVLVHELFHFLLPDRVHVSAHFQPANRERTSWYPRGDPYDFRDAVVCDTINAAGNAMTWATFERLRTAVVELDVYANVAPESLEYHPWNPLSRVKSSDSSWNQLWSHPGEPVTLVDGRGRDVREGPPSADDVNRNQIPGSGFGDLGLMGSR